MKFVSYKIYEGKPGLSGLPSTYIEDDSEADTLEILFKDELTGLELTYVYTAFSQFDAITRSVKARNTGMFNINIKEIMSCNVDFPRDDFDFIHLPGALKEKALFLVAHILKVEEVQALIIIALFLH